jgi:hypothetical protein
MSVDTQGHVRACVQVSTARSCSARSREESLSATPGSACGTAPASRYSRSNGAAGRHACCPCLLEERRLRAPRGPSQGGVHQTNLALSLVPAAAGWWYSRRSRLLGLAPRLTAQHAAAAAAHEIFLVTRPRQRQQRQLGVRRGHAARPGVAVFRRSGHRCRHGRLAAALRSLSKLAQAEVPRPSPPTSDMHVALCVLSPARAGDVGCVICVHGCVCDRACNAERARMRRFARQMQRASPA